MVSNVSGDLPEWGWTVTGFVEGHLVDAPPLAVAIWRDGEARLNSSSLILIWLLHVCLPREDLSCLGCSIV